MTNSKPKQVKLAINTLWIMFVLSIVSGIFSFSTYHEMMKEATGSAELTINTSITSIAITFIINAFLIFIIAKKKRWARNIFLALVIFSWIGMASVSGLDLLFALIIAIGETVAIYLLFKKDAKEWFNS
jgi:hypothetical protein